VFYVVMQKLSAFISRKPAGEQKGAALEKGSP